MIRVLIVDDERWVRKSIIGKANWKMLGAEVVAEAPNGLDALHLVENLSPNIVITDMRMPDMDGVGLIQAIREKYPLIKIIVISGYSDFEYTKQALKNKVEDYILKPIEEEVLNECLEKTIKAIHLEEKEENERLDLKTKAQESEKALREMFLNKVVFDKSLADDELKEGCRKNFVTLDFMYYQVCCFNISNPHKMNNNELNSDLSKYESDIMSVLNKNFMKENGICFRNFKNTLEYICIIGDFNENPNSKTLHSCEKATYELNSNFGFSCSCGIGRQYEGFSRISKSYLEAAKASRFIDLVDNKKVLHIYDIDSLKVVNSPFNLDEKKEILFSSINTGNVKEIDTVIDNIFDSFKKYEIMSLDEIQLFSINLLFSMNEELNQLGFSLKEIFLEDVLFSQTIQSYTTLEAIKGWLKDIFYEIGKYCLMTLDNNTETLVLRAKDYISINCSKKLSLKDMSIMFHISEVYFSKVFKFYTGQNFIQFLTNIRMQKALEYLQNSSIKVVDVASMVGYDDYRHFSKLFKKQFNCSPSDIRSQLNLDRRGIF